MGDRCSVLIKFGGPITQAQGEELLEALIAYDFTVDGNGSEPEFSDLDEDFYADEINYGEIDQIEAVCVKYDIPYEKWNGAGGDYGERIKRFNGIEDRTTCCSDGEPMVAYKEVIKVETLASCMAQLIADARFWCDEFPNAQLEH